jgi:hypothetical protein
MPSFIKFVEVDLRDGRKTQVWAVLTLDGRHCLGRIGWYSPWRKYCYVISPVNEQVILEETCLGDIADFCKMQTFRRREMRKQTRTRKVEVAS